MDTPDAPSRQDGGGAAATLPKNDASANVASEHPTEDASTKDGPRKDNGDWSKRKRGFEHGDRNGGRGGRNNGKRFKKGDMGRGEYL